MKEAIIKLVRKFAGLEPVGGDHIDLTPGGGARIRSTVNPNPGLKFNDIAGSLHAESQRLGAGRFRPRNRRTTP